MVRQSRHGRTGSWAGSRGASRRKRKGRSTCCSLIAHPTCTLRRLLAVVAALLEVHQPGHWNDEQRCQEEPEERIEPDQRDVEAAQPDADPQNGQWSLTFHARLLLRVTPENRAVPVERATLWMWR